MLVAREEEETLQCAPMTAAAAFTVKWKSFFSPAFTRARAAERRPKTGVFLAREGFDGVRLDLGGAQEGINRP